MPEPDASTPPQPEPPPTPGSDAQPGFFEAPEKHLFGSKDGADPWAHRRGEPRTFVALWIVYLLAATVISIGALGAFGMLSLDVYRPAARSLLVLTAIGIGVLWPMLRLSQEHPRQPMRSMLVDFVVVVLPVQALLWPQALPWMANWSVPLVAGLAAVFAAWGALVSGILALYFAGPTRIARWAVMLFIVLIVGWAPMWSVTMGDSVFEPAWRAMASPVTAPLALTKDRAEFGSPPRIEPDQWRMIAAVACAAATAWLAALCQYALNRTKPRGAFAAPGRPV